MPPTTADTTAVDAVPPAPSGPTARTAAARARDAARGLYAFVRRFPYVVTCVGLTVAFLAIAYGTSAHIGVPVRDPEGALLGRRMVGPVLLIGAFAFLDSVLRALRQRSAGTTEPLVRLAVGIFLERWWWRRLLLGLVGFLSFAFTYLAYRNLKSFVSLINYRTYDTELLALDHWMAFGHDPATLLHRWFGTTIAAQVFSWIYLVYIPLVPASVSAAIAFVERMREAYVFVAAYMWCWILGTASYYAIPTLGPFASRPRLFTDLESTNVSRLQNNLESVRLQLHSDNIGDNIVGGIAGFASLHVGIVVAAWLLMRYYRQRTLAWAALAYLVPVTISTSYFGWHFLIDDVAGCFIGWLSVVLGRVTVYPRLLVAWRHRAGRRLHAGT